MKTGTLSSYREVPSGPMMASTTTANPVAVVAIERSGVSRAFPFDIITSSVMVRPHGLVGGGGPWLLKNMFRTARKTIENRWTKFQTSHL